MCLIIKNLEGKPIPFSVIRAAVKNNRDGYGRLDLPSGKVRKTMDMQEAVKMAMEPGKAVHHFRLSTAGTKSVDNVHPFEITKNWLLFHNGSVPSFNGKVNSDSSNLARFLGRMNKKDWEEAFELFDGNRFLAIHRRTGECIQRGDQWTQKDGIWYSNSYHFRSDTMVGVYGNLSDGAVLNKELLKKNDFVAKGETELKHRLCYIGNMPFLLHGDGAASGEPRGETLEMDIYEVNDNTLEKLDIIHHHPGFYERKLTQFESFAEGTLFAWVYYCTDERMDSGKYYYWDNKKEEKQDTTPTTTTTTQTSLAVVHDDDEEVDDEFIERWRNKNIGSDKRDEHGGRWTEYGYVGPDDALPGEDKPKESPTIGIGLKVYDGILEDLDDDDEPFETYEIDPDQVFSDGDIKDLQEIGLFFMKEETPSGHRFCDEEGRTYDDAYVAQYTNMAGDFGKEKPTYVD